MPPLERMVIERKAETSGTIRGSGGLRLPGAATHSATAPATQPALAALSQS